MKPSYSGFEAKKSGGFTELPPPGVYVAEIQNVRYVPADMKQQTRDAIEMMIEITEGDYKNRYHEVYEDRKERFGDSVKYKGVFRLNPPVDGDEDWRKRQFEGNLWCVEQSNPGYSWDWDEKQLKGKKIGINIRKRLYTWNGEDREDTEIGKFETVDDVKAGRCKPMKERNTRRNNTANETPQFTEVESAKVDVPW